ncbi:MULTISPECIES: hypothetical protein [unclassified Chryseobacterium]|uniref:hypothetical protein n=1 Tax=unclassified Chryseobacterium TaxID=2593645 RepID=UPI000D70C42F|nr:MULTISPECIES: hypothetical protein [unclassified Chryseobacterium]PWW29887.1 hypothetical protein DEU40_102129 [Chryseobacterium sp. AG844]
MKIKDLLYLFFALALAGFMLFSLIYSPKKEDKFIIDDINTNIEGKIKRKVAVRKNLLTHVLIERAHKNDTLIFLGEAMDSVQIGDNLFKQKNSPFFYVSRQGEKNKKLKYVLIPKSVVDDNNFPDAWKDSCRNNWKNVVIDN